MQHATHRSPLAISLGMAIALITPSARADCFDDAAYQQVTASQKNNCAKYSSRCATKRRLPAIRTRIKRIIHCRVT